MKTASFVISAVALTVVLSPAFAQSPPPSRIANVWDGRHHQPTQAEVGAQERAAGIALTPAQQQATLNTIHHLDQEIQDQQIQDRSHG